MSLSQRFTALDVFRGMTVCFMIIVNNQGSGAEPFAPLEHAAWHGFTPTDLVFPSFLFAVGNAMAFTMPKFQTMNQSAVLSKIFKRTLLIFLIGYLLYWFPFVKLNEANEWVMKPIETTRIFGVLQRIALCYGAASLMIYYLSKRSVIILSVVFLLGYWLLMYITKLLLGGAVLLAIAYCWNYSFPINKKLWTGSFTLYTCGIDLMLISFLVYILDKTNYRKDWTYFFEVFGKNPLFIYLLSDFVPIIFNMLTDAKGRSYEEAINLDVFQKLTPGPFGSFFYSATLMIFCWAVGYWMDKKKVYVRV